MSPRVAGQYILGLSLPFSGVCCHAGLLCACDPNSAPHVLQQTSYLLSHPHVSQCVHFFLFIYLIYYLFDFFKTGFHITERTLNFGASCPYLPSAAIISVCHHDWHVGCFMSGWHRQESFGKRKPQLKKSPHQIGKRTTLWYIFLMRDWGWRLSPL